MTNYEIKTNPEFNSTEITFDGKPSEAVRNILKDMRFRWHGVKKVWYGYKDEETVKNAIDNAENGKTKAAPKAEKKNKYGVKVGDIFSASWGYEQTNVDFFQVIALVGECSVRVREVYPKMVDESPTCSMAADRTYQLTNELLPAAERSVFIKDQENGDLKRLRSYRNDETDCSFNLSSFASAYICKGDTAKVYESWYA
jgi:hypothetical protein